MGADFGRRWAFGCWGVWLSALGVWRTGGSGGEGRSFPALGFSLGLIIFVHVRVMTCIAVDRPLLDSGNGWSIGDFAAGLFLLTGVGGASIPI